ncbi:hypothetical protein Golob_024025 [Gossypium lobatum]|uniref:Uncharacterized protein n=1 Tax=Gossypium lobatum TaxID=34289 RepID=A0A7J8NL31_9ROSI|nr:hypothetical protein [Gossypium lobatum]
MCANVLVVISSLQHVGKQKDLKWLTVWRARLLAILPRCLMLWTEKIFCFRRNKN